MEPATITAAMIAQLAFNEFIKSSAGEAAKKLTGEALTKANDLRKAIWAKFRGNERAETALEAVEKQGTTAAVDRVTKYLDLEMEEDGTFAAEVQQMAQQIINIQNQSTNTADRIYNQQAGRDIFNLDNAGQNNKFGGS
jgi:adenosyl cobinamide kinase/adenosyl cobinamide phosphate guanylyltransferase